MKLLSEGILKEYGFNESSEIQMVAGARKVMSKNNFDIFVKNDGFYYINLGFEYPIRDTATLRKLYKEVKREDLKLFQDDSVFSDNTKY